MWICVDAQGVWGIVSGGEKPPKNGGEYPCDGHGNLMAEIIGMALRASRSFPRKLGTPP
jgi:hypothetical protein